MPQRKLPVLLAASLSLAACQSTSSSPQESAVEQATSETSTAGPGLAFRLGPATLDSVADLDSAVATVRYHDGEIRTVRTTVAKIRQDAMGTIALANLPLKDCRVEIVFASADGKSRITVTIQIHVDASYDTTATRACDDDRIVVDGTVLDNGDLVLKPWQDAWIGPVDNNGNNNNGVGSELRLWEGGSMGVLDFGDISSILAGRVVAKAELVLRGWKGDIDIGDATPDLSIDLGTVPRGWSEGNGHWYWFDGAGQNGYERAFSDWPGFLPPDCARNPANAGGIRWNDDGGVREGFRKISTFVPDLQDGKPWVYPTAAEVGVVRLDVTESVQSQVASGASLGFGLRRATTSRGPAESVSFYSKDHAPSVSPSLVIQFAK